MLKRRTYLPDIWSNPYIAAIPYFQEGDVLKYMDEYGECRIIDINDCPMPGQDWIEAVALCLGSEFESDAYVSGEIQRICGVNTTSISAPGMRLFVLKNILRHLSAGKRLLLYLHRPIPMRESGFEYLTRVISSSIGIIGHVSSMNDVPVAAQIQYFEIKKCINEGHPVYISYSRKDSTPLAEMICESLESKSVDCMFDMRDVPIQSSIHEFELAIGRGDYVIVILSDNYFESPDCMFEMAALTKRGDISNRVVFVSNLQNVKRNKKSHDLILKKWKERRKEYDMMDSNNVAMKREKDDLDLIIDYFPEFWLHAKDDVAFLAPDVIGDSASAMTDYIVDLFKKKNHSAVITTRQLHDPINSGDTPTIVVHQTGHHSIYIGAVNGDVHLGG